MLLFCPVAQANASQKRTYASFAAISGQASASFFKKNWFYFSLKRNLSIKELFMIL